MKHIDDELPEKGINIRGLDPNGYEYICFRCTCTNPNCLEWQDAKTKLGLIIDIVQWEYLN
jgi:hypothetical protein